MRLTKSVATSAVAAAVVMGGLVFAPEAAIARPLGACVPYSSSVEIDGASSIKITHLVGLHLGPGSVYDKPKAIPAVVTLTAGISVTTGGEVSAQSIIAAAEEKFKTTLAPAGTATNGGDETVDLGVAAESFDRYFAAFSATRAWTGTYTVHQCNAAGTAVSIANSGSWVSFSDMGLDSETALCVVGKQNRSSSYGRGSAAYLACNETWW